MRSISILSIVVFAAWSAGCGDAVKTSPGTTSRNAPSQSAPFRFKVRYDAKALVLPPGGRQSVPLEVGRSEKFRFQIENLEGGPAKIFLLNNADAAEYDKLTSKADDVGLVDAAIDAVDRALPEGVTPLAPAFQGKDFDGRFISEWANPDPSGSATLVIENHSNKKPLRFDVAVHSQR